MTESHIIADTMRLLRNLSDERLRILEAWTIEMRVNEPGHPAGLWLMATQVLESRGVPRFTIPEREVLLQSRGR